MPSLAIKLDKITAIELPQTIVNRFCEEGISIFVPTLALAGLMFDNVTVPTPVLPNLYVTVIGWERRPVLRNWIDLGKKFNPFYIILMGIGSLSELDCISFGDHGVSSGKKTSK